MADHWYQAKLGDLKKPGTPDRMIAETVIPRENGRASVLDSEHVWSPTLESPPQANSLENLKTVSGKEAEELLLLSETAVKPDSELYHKLLILMADRALRIVGEATRQKRNDPLLKTKEANYSQSPESPTLSEVWASFERQHSKTQSPKEKRKVDTYRSDFSTSLQMRFLCYGCEQAAL